MRFTITIFLLLCWLIVGNIAAAKDNNSKEKTKVLTLSNGRYEEFFDQDSIEQIGSVLYNVNTQNVIGFVEADTSQATLKPEIISRWLSIDPLAAKYPGISPYVFVANNPIIHIDPDGRDLVYFNSGGQEVKRIASSTKFETYVEGNGRWNQAPMPKVIKGYELPKYQQYDYNIAAQTYIFNNTPKESRPTTAGGQRLNGGEPANLDPTLVKSIIMQETKMGTFAGASGQNGTQDIMQSNVWLSETSNDWGDYKEDFGLTKQGSATPNQSVYAGIRILYMKGLGTNTIRDKKGKITGYDTYWRGGNLDNWWKAVDRYNGGGDPGYTDKVRENYNNAQDGVQSNYVEMRK